MLTFFKAFFALLYLNKIEYDMILVFLRESNAAALNYEKLTGLSTSNYASCGSMIPIRLWCTNWNKGGISFSLGGYHDEAYAWTMHKCFDWNPFTDAFQLNWGKRHFKPSSVKPEASVGSWV